MPRFQPPRQGHPNPFYQPDCNAQPRHNDLTYTEVEEEFAQTAPSSPEYNKQQATNTDRDIILINVPVETISLIDEDSPDDMPTVSAAADNYEPDNNEQSAGSITVDQPELTNAINGPDVFISSQLPLGKKKRKKLMSILRGRGRTDIAKKIATSDKKYPLPQAILDGLRCRRARTRPHRLQGNLAPTASTPTVQNNAPPQTDVDDLTKPIIDLTEMDKQKDCIPKQVQLRVAITTDPPTFLVHSHAEMLKNIITEKILLAAHQCKFVPSFRGRPTLSKGTLKMWCDDENALQWLRITLAELTAPQNGRYIVVPVDDLDVIVRAGILLPGQTVRDVRLALKMLSQQNSWDKILNWTVLRARVQRSGMFLTLGIPLSDIPKLMSLEKRLFYLMGNVYVRFFRGNRLCDTLPPFVVNILGNQLIVGKNL